MSSCAQQRGNESNYAGLLNVFKLTFLKLKLVNGKKVIIQPRKRNNYEIVAFSLLIILT